MAVKSQSEWLQNLHKNAWKEKEIQVYIEVVKDLGEKKVYLNYTAKIFRRVRNQ